MKKILFALAAILMLGMAQESMAQQKKRVPAKKTVSKKGSTTKSYSRANMLGGPKVMTFDGIRLRSNIDAFVAALKPKGYNLVGNIVYGEDGSCVAAAIFQSTAKGHQINITVQAGPERHLVDEVIYEESGFATESEARLRMNAVRQDKMHEMDHLYIIENGFYVWRYGYIKWETKKAAFEDTYYFVMRIIDHPAHCLSIRETNKCFKASMGISGMKSLEETKELPDEKDVKEVPATDNENGSSIPIPTPMPIKEDSIINRGVARPLNIIALTDRVIVLNKFDAIQKELEEKEFFKFSESKWEKFITGKSSKYPDGTISVKQKFFRRLEYSEITVFMTQPDRSKVKNILEQLGYKLQRENNIMSTYYDYYNKGSKHVEIKATKESVQCVFTIKE